MVSAFSKLVTPIGEFTILAELVVAVIESKKPAVVADKNKDNNKNIDK